MGIGSCVDTISMILCSNTHKSNFLGGQWLYPMYSIHTGLFDRSFCESKMPTHSFTNVSNSAPSPYEAASAPTSRCSTFRKNFQHSLEHPSSRPPPFRLSPSVYAESPAKLAVVKSVNAVGSCGRSHGDARVGIRM